MSEMYVAAGRSPVDAHEPCGVYWKMPFLPPVESQLATEPSPAPMSDEITAMCTLGMPPGWFFSVCISTGKFRRRLSCDSRIDDESSTRNSRSTLRLLA